MSKKKSGFMSAVYAVTYQDAFQRHGVDAAKLKKMHANGVGDADGGKAYEITPLFAMRTMDGRAEPGKKCKVAAANFLYAAYSGNVREVLPQEVIDAYEADLKAHEEYQSRTNDEGILEGDGDGITDEKGKPVSVDGAAVSTDAGDAGDGKKPRKGGRKGGKKGGDAGDGEGG